MRPGEESLQPVHDGRIDAARAQALAEQYDPELNFRRMSPWAGRLVTAVLVAFSLYHYYTAGFGLPRDLIHKGTHLAFVLGLIFLVYGLFRHEHTALRTGWWRPGGIPLWDWALALFAAAAALWLPLLPLAQVAMRVGNPSTGDVVAGSLVILLVLEGARRSMGWTLPLIIGVFILYALYGQNLPGVLAHPGASWTGFVNHVYMTDDGIYGIPIRVIAQFVFHFVLFGVLATRIGLGQLFIDVATVMAGRFAGGPAKVAVVSSAFMGMISGSSIANTVTTGSLTIPAMKRIGYQPHFAGAVEATASTGGQITPPIMGAAAFIMVEFLQIPYREIIVAAIVPAALHFFGVLVMVHLEAKRLHLRGLRPDEMPQLWQALRPNWPTLIPLVIITWMIMSGRTPDNAAFWGITACIVVGFLNPTNRLTLRDLAEAFATGAKYTLAVSAAAAAVGIIIGVVTLTGLGLRLGYLINEFSAGLADFFSGLVPFGMLSLQQATLFFTLVFTAIACIIMGAGIPTTVTYITLVTIAVPALGLLQVPALVTHFFVFYYGVLADITPPVALAAYAAAGIAGSNPFTTGNTAFRLAIAKALVPFVFVYSPSLLIVVEGFTWLEFTVTLTGAVIGVFFLGAAFTGYLLAPMRWWERWLLGISALIFVAPGLETFLPGLAIALVPLLRQVATWRRAATA